MNKSNLILASVLAIIFTSILIIFSPTSKKFSLSSPSPSPISTESISPTPDPTTDWKTYENKEYGFSLKIPNYLITKSRPNFPLWIDFWNESDDTTGYYKYYRNTLLNDPENYKLPLFWIYIDGNSMKALQGDGGNGPQELSYIKPINENFGLFYFGFDFTDQVCATEKNGKTIMIECSDKNLSDPLFNQILSTFKFTDENDKKLSWVSIDYPKYKLSFKIPKNWYFSNDAMDLSTQQITKNETFDSFGNVLYVLDNPKSTNMLTIMLDPTKPKYFDVLKTGDLLEFDQIISSIKFSP